jgi:beta-aspartyl-peptidase (threonine type)
MRNSDHVILSGEGANDFAIKQNIQFEPDDYFFRTVPVRSMAGIRHSDAYALDHSAQTDQNEFPDKKFGTTGAVACDKNGNIACGHQHRRHDQ